MARNEFVKTGQTCFDTKGWREMVEVGRLVDGVEATGVELFADVQDSLLKSFCTCVTDTCVLKKSYSTTSTPPMGSAPLRL